MKADNLKKLFILAIISTFLLTTGTIIIEPVSAAPRLGAVVAFIQSAEASQGPSYITFDSLGDCHKFAKQSDGVYDKKDCEKGSPPSDDPEDID